MLQSTNETYLESDTWENLPAPEGSFLEQELGLKMAGEG